MLRAVRIACRGLLREPGFSAAAIATLALGIGAATTIFSVAYGVWLKPLPFGHAERIVTLRETHVASGAGASLSLATINDIESQVSSFASVAAYSYGAGFLSENGELVRVVAYRVSPRLFDLLQVRPAIGRALVDADRAGADGEVAVASDRFWRTHLHSDPNVVGSTISLQERVIRIVGVMPRAFHFPEGIEGDLWVPLTAVGGARDERYYEAVARLGPGVTVEQAQAELAGVAARIGAAFPSTNAGWTATMTPLVEATVGGYRGVFGALVGAVAVLLLIACANVASMLMARFSSRHAEMATRAALGASRGQLVQQAFVESLVLASLGGMAGVLLAVLAVPALTSLMPDMTTRLSDVRPDGTMLVASLVATLGTGLICGIAPVLRSARMAGPGAWAARSIVGGSRLRGHALLVVVEVALSAVLLAGGGLMMQSFTALMQHDNGYEPAGLLTTHLVLPYQRLGSTAARDALLGDVLARLRSMPDVEAASAVTGYPGSALGVLGYGPAVGDPANPESRSFVALRAIDPGYFAAMKTPIVAGRSFTADDRDSATPVVIVNQSVANKFWPGSSAVGKRIRLPQFGTHPEGFEVTVVGVAGDMRTFTDAGSDVFVPMSQSGAFWADLVIRARPGHGDLAKPVRETLKSVAPDFAIEGMSPMREVLVDSIALFHAQSVIVAAFAAMAGVLAAVGLYGLLAYSVAQRLPEIAVRMALGANRRSVYVSLIRRAAWLTGAGLAFGSLATWGVIEYARASVFGFQTIDPWVFVGAVVLLALAALAATLVPAKRAVKADPASLLRA